MKRLAFTLTLFLILWQGQAQVSKTVNVTIPGTLTYLLTTLEINTVTNLKVTGTIDARDFKFLCDSIGNLSILDLEGVQIAAYNGYSAKQLPRSAFCNTTNGVGKRSLTSVTLPATITVIGENAFSDCTGLSSIIIPSSVTSIEGYAFYNCKSLSTINIPENVSTLGNSPFRSCTANLTVSPSNPNFIVEDGVLFNSSKTTLIECQYNKTGDYAIPSSVTTISDNAFTDCSNLTNIIIPSSGVAINAFSFAFCTGLTTVTIPANLKTLGFGAFAGCTGLTSVFSFITSPETLSFTFKPFFDVDKNLCKLYVPKGTLEIYKTTSPWSEFLNIFEMNTIDVQTLAVSSITLNSAVFNGNIISSGTTPITSYGFCWSTYDSLIVTDNKVDNGSNTALGVFNNTISGLTEGTTYYVKAYATNNNETVYGNQVTFTTASIPEPAGSILGATTVCQGQNEVFYIVPIIKNATSYFWTFPSGASYVSSTNSITANYELNSASGNLTVKGQNEWYEGMSSTLAITVNLLPANSGIISGSSSVCQGDNSVTYSVPLIDYASSYKWTLPSGATGTSITNNITVNFSMEAISGNISVMGNNDCGDGVAYSLPIEVNQLPIVTTTNKSIVSGSSISLNPNINYYGIQPLKYKWTPSTGLDNDSIANPTATVTKNVTYTITVTTPNGCSATNSLNVNIIPMSQPEIGIVGINSSNKNMVIWNKQVSTGISSFNIYKETTVSDIYEKVGNVSYDSLSVFIDNQSNPDVKSNKYKISILDKSGLESPQSNAHKTMHLSINKGQNNAWNLIWEPYEGFNVLTYNIYRGTSANSLNFLDATSGSSTQYSDITASTGDVYYQLEVISPTLINPTKAPASIQKSKQSGSSTLISYNSSRSNIATNTLSAINELTGNNNQINIYPNPAKDHLSIDFEGGSTFEILNLMGQVVYNGDLTKNVIVQTSSFFAGVYMIKFKTGNTFEYRKIIKE